MPDFRLTIRTADTSDSARLSAFARQIFEETFAADNTPEDMAAYVADAFSEAKQRAEIEDPATLTLLCEDAGTLVAYAQLKTALPPACVPDVDAIELVRFYVDRARHGQGIAQRLMAAVIDRAAAESRGVWLGVWERNARAIAFYKKCGFEDVGTQVFMLGSDAQTDRVMLRRVAPPQ